MDEQSDEIAGGPVETGAMLGVLRSVGLVGPKLALQVGNEEAVARQVSERAGVMYSEWTKKLITAQIRDACESMELDLRVAGEKASPAVQAINDATLAQKKEKEEEAVERKQKRPRHLPVPVILPGKGKMMKLGRPTRSMARLLEPEEDRVIRLLVSELEIMRAPILDQMDLVMDKQRAQQSLMGQYRASTVKRYLAYWQNYRLWVVKMCGVQPKNAAQLIDYLHAREEEGMGASVPLSVSKAVSWFERVAGFEPERCISDDPLLSLIVKGLLKRLEDTTPPRKRAPRFLSCFIPALERIVMDRSQEDSLRLGAWAKLLKVWASFRFDDLAHVRVNMTKVYDGKMSGLLKRTKTTGAGKRVKELPFHISSKAWVVKKDWLLEGWRISGAAMKSDDLLIPAGSSGPEDLGDDVMQYVEAVAWSCEIMKAMEDGKGNRLIPDSWERFWTEHSERATVSSALAALGVPKSDRDLLGRWAPEGSDQYVRTYNAVVGNLQEKFMNPIRQGVGYTAFDEGAILKDLKDWLREKWGIEKKVAEDAVENWKKQLAPVEGGITEMLAEGAQDDNQSEVSSAKGGRSLFERKSSSSSSSSGDEDKDDRLSVERETGFVVVYNRIDRGRLHRGGPKGCWMAKARKFRRATSFASMPDPGSYTSRCKRCWPLKRDESSSSDSEDELVDDEPLEEPVSVQNVSLDSWL